VSTSAPFEYRTEALLENPNSRLVIVGQILCILVPLAVWFSPLPLEPVTKHGFAIVGFMVVAWITRAMDYALAGLVGCFLFWALGVVRFSVAFSGFETLVRSST
jgi:di/tricarboxylate transporter